MPCILLKLLSALCSTAAMLSAMLWRVSRREGRWARHSWCCRPFTWLTLCSYSLRACVRVCRCVWGYRLFIHLFWEEGPQYTLQQAQPLSFHAHTHSGSHLLCLAWGDLLPLVELVPWGRSPGVSTLPVQTQQAGFPLTGTATHTKPLAHTHLHVASTIQTCYTCPVFLLYQKEQSSTPSQLSFPPE